MLVCVHVYVCTFVSLRVYVCMTESICLCVRTAVCFVAFESISMMTLVGLHLIY